MAQAEIIVGYGNEFDYPPVPARCNDCNWPWDYSIPDEPVCMSCGKRPLGFSNYESFARQKSPMHQYTSADLSQRESRRKSEARQESRRIAHKERMLKRNKLRSKDRLLNTLKALKLYLGCWDIEKPHQHKLNKSVEQIAPIIQKKTNTVYVYIKGFVIQPNIGPANTKEWNMIHTFIYEYMGLSELQIAFALNSSWEAVKTYRRDIETFVVTPPRRVRPKPGNEVYESDLKTAKDESIVG